MLKDLKNVTHNGKKGSHKFSPFIRSERSARCNWRALKASNLRLAWEIGKVCSPLSISWPNNRGNHVCCDNRQSIGCHHLTLVEDIVIVDHVCGDNPIYQFVITHLLRMLSLIMPWWQSNTLSSHTCWRCRYWSHSSDNPSIVIAELLKTFWQSINSHGIIVEYSHLKPLVIAIRFVCSKMISPLKCFKC